ncbi:MAG: aminopeptidase P family protein [Bacteroidales bacterium]
MKTTRYNPISSQMYIRNREKLVSQLKINSLVIVNSNDEMPKNGDQTFLFRQHSTLFYLTGIDQEKTILTICPHHPNPSLREIIFIINADPTTLVWQGYKLSPQDVTELSGVKTVKFVDSFESVLRELMVFSENVYLYQNDYIKFFTDVPCKDDRFALEIKNKYPLHNYLPLTAITSPMRAVKEPEEIAQMKIACGITRDAFLRVLKMVKPGVMEYEVEAEYTHEFIRQGANGHAFDPIIASGKDTCVLHYINNNKECKDGDLLLMDVGADYGNYAADMSRTIPINGKFSKRQKQVYMSVLDVLNQATALLVPGSCIDKWHKQVCKLIENELVKLGLLTSFDIENQNPDSPAFFKYYMHGSGHFLGLDTHDTGSKFQTFVPGMVITCEPGIYIPDENIGIRLENDILITDNQPVNLMSDIPILPEEIEKIMCN